MTALGREILDALSSDEGKALLRAVFADVVGVMPTANLDELVSVDVAAKIRGVSPAAIYKLIARSKLKNYGTGKQKRVRRGDLLR